MANLVPGFLFNTPGLNRNFTSIPNTITPKDHDKVNGRHSFPRHTWSFNHPDSRGFDVSETSTDVIAPNNNNQT
ncbi:hypothetical protein CHS0354_019961, partial [Potamilus streckersoni]